jgi:hypothetical protein
VARQPSPPEQLSGRAALRPVNRDNRHSAKHAVHARVCGAAAQDLSESRRGRYDTAMPPPGSLETVPRLRVAAAKLDETLCIEDQSAAYSSS